MKHFKLFLFGLTFLGLFNFASAQKLLPGAYRFSEKKVSYITLNVGTQVDGYIQEIDRKKGLFLSFKIKDLAGQMHEFRSTEIRNMYLAPSGWDNFSKDYDFMSDPDKWDNDNYNKSLFKDGYVYFEQSEVDMGGKTRMLLMQLLNPSFSSKIKIYLDPYVSEASSIRVAEGGAKSYYIKDGSFLSFKLNKKEFKDNFIALFGDCEHMVVKKEKAKWSQLNEYVYEFSHCE